MFGSPGTIPSLAAAFCRYSLVGARPTEALTVLIAALLQAVEGGA
jgi:hypothetical protein